jgi:uncharacterized membrane protein
MPGEKETAKPPASGGSSSGDDSKLWAALCYALPILVPILVLVMEDKKKDKFILFHAYQALILGIVVWGINFILSFVVIGCITAVFGWLYMLYLGYRAYQGERFVLPTIGEYAEKQMK